MLKISFVFGDLKTGCVLTQKYFGMMSNRECSTFLHSCPLSQFCLLLFVVTAIRSNSLRFRCVWCQWSLRQISCLSHFSLCLYLMLGVYGRACYVICIFYAHSALFPVILCCDLGCKILITRKPGSESEQQEHWCVCVWASVNWSDDLLTSACKRCICMSV